MSETATDFYHKKTDAELLFFVEHPDYYQPSLVDAARRELLRRGVRLAGPDTPAYVPDNTPDTSSKTGVIVLFAAVLAICFGTYYFVKQKNDAQAAAATAAAASHKNRPAPQLKEVATSVIPSYDVAAAVSRQLAKVPAAEKANAQHLRQYNELAKRFWTAETQTEYVLQEAQTKHFTSALPGHVEGVGTAWQQWNKAMAYSYKLGPTMDTHVDLMKRVAQQQQEGLADLLIVARNPQPFQNKQTEQRAADVNDLLSGLLPASPVTGKPYRAMVRHITL